MANVNRREVKRRKHTRKTSISSHKNAIASFAAAEAEIVQEKRFQDLKELPELELLEAATELTLRK